MGPLLLEYLTSRLNQFMQLVLPLAQVVEYSLELVQLNWIWLGKTLKIKERELDVNNAYLLDTSAPASRTVSMFSSLRFQSSMLRTSGA